MKTTLLTIVLALSLSGTAQAACYADYQAKTDNPLRLHYGVIQLSDAACNSTEQAKIEADSRLRAGGWTLLTILSTFGNDGLNARRADAGQNFLRF